MALQHTVKGPVNYTVVGHPTIVDGVASGFSSSDTVRIQGASAWTGNYELVIAFTTPETASTFNGLLGQGTTKMYFRNGTLGFQYWGGSSNIWKTLATGLNNNTKYYIKLARKDDTAWYSYISTDGINYTLTYTEKTYLIGIATTPLVFGYVDSTYPKWNGSIDFNETYIKINGQPWFGLCPVEVQKHQLRGPVGYTVVGSPTISEGIASGFSASDYCAVSSAFIDSGVDFELCVTFTVNTIQNRPILGVTNAYSNQRPMLSLTSSGDIVRFKIANGLTLIADCHISAGVKYKAIVSRFGTTYTLNLYSGETLLDTQTLTSETLIGNGASNTFAVGCDKSTHNAGFPGSIDLNETYIKVNGKLWFYQPADTKYIVKDGKLVWADPLIYIEDNGTKTYATQHIAPVPAGYTFGTTTTPSIGYVDMRTQQFTAAPQGATIGREEA